MQKSTDIIRDVERLKEPFKSLVKRLMVDIKSAGLRLSINATMKGGSGTKLIGR